MSNPRLAVDIGGTFTDVVLERAGSLTSVKVLTTPDSPETGFLEGVNAVLQLAGVEPGHVSTIVHGTTLATNALIERKVARTALVTTAGFRDSLEIGYEARYDQYDLNLQRLPPLVPRERRLCVTERIGPSGQVLEDLDESGVLSLCARLREDGVQAVAVGFLHAYANPAHELRAGEILAGELPGVALSLSSGVCPEIREYERLTTTVANACVQPMMARYLRSLRERLGGAGIAAPVLMVTSAGGVTTLETAIRFPIRLVESGPSGGAVLAETIAERYGETRVVSYDMGGTTAKICLIHDGRARVAREFEAARAARFKKGSGLPLRIPVVEMIEVGAGGGSLARVDALQRIAVGPDSAGAEPGPACYGRGGVAPTVTDADLALGRIDPSRFAGGRLPLDVSAAVQSVDTQVASRLNIETPSAAFGIVEMVDETMANAARVHAAEHAADLRDYSMIAFGGAGPLHAARLAQKLGIERLIIPPDPGVGSAVGFLAMPVSYQAVRSHYMTLSQFDAGAVNTLFDELARQARDVVRQADPHGELLERRSALMRYCGQGHEIDIELADLPLDDGGLADIRAQYGRRYRELYSRELPDGEIEILTWMVTTSARRSLPAQRAKACNLLPLGAPCETRPVYDASAGTFVDTRILQRNELAPGTRFHGPALIAEMQTTTLVPDNFQVDVQGDGGLVLRRQTVANQRRCDAVTGEPCDVQLQVIWNRMQSIVDEQASVLMRTAFSPIVRESGDLSAGVFDASGRMLAQAVTGTPGHVNTMASACRRFFASFPPESMVDGDIYLTNDPWLGAGHLNDFVLLKPCFNEGRLVGFLSCTSHLVDIGGRCLGPDGNDVYDEGLYVPPLALLSAGRIDTTFVTLLKANSRAPRQAEGDLFALIACCEKGALRLADMLQAFALHDLHAVAERILTTSERSVRHLISQLPDARHSYAMTVDGYEQPITIEANLDIAGSDLLLDFFASAPPSRHGINVPLNYTEAYAVFGLKCAIAPEIPNNHGSLLPFGVTAAAGSILNAIEPAPVASRHILGQLLPDVALGCLREVLPAVVPAEGAATLWDLPLNGVRRDAHGDVRTFAAELVFNGGTGARPGSDGLSATAYPSGVMGSLVEVTEAATPLLIRRREFRRDSGGAGTWRGGLGQIIELEALEGVPIAVYGTVDRVRYPARGCEGGGSGATGRFEHSGGQPFEGKGVLTLQPAERLLVLTPGGGGYGDPLCRNPDLVAADVSRGLVSPAEARALYRVVVSADGRLDVQGTDTLRNGCTEAEQRQVK